MATQKQIAEAEAKAKALAEQGETIPEAVTKLEAPDAELPDSEMSDDYIMAEVRAVRYGKKANR